MDEVSTGNENFFLSITGASSNSQIQHVSDPVSAPVFRALRGLGECQIPNDIERGLVVPNGNILTAFKLVLIELLSTLM